MNCPTCTKKVVAEKPLEFLELVRCPLCRSTLFVDWDSYDRPWLRSIFDCDFELFSIKPDEVEEEA